MFCKETFDKFSCLSHKHRSKFRIWRHALIRLTGLYVYYLYYAIQLKIKLLKKFFAIIFRILLVIKHK